VAPLFDIFKCESDGSVIWQDAVDTLDSARTRVQILAAKSSGAYIVFNHSTGQKISLGKIETYPAAKKSVA